MIATRARMWAEEQAFVVGRRVRRSPRADRRKRLVLHAGFRKCGSSFLQETFRENYHLVAPYAAVCTRYMEPRTRDLADAAIAVTRAGGRRAAGIRLRMELSRFAARVRSLPQPVVIVSEECLTGNLTGNRDGDTFAHGARLLAVIEDELKEFDLEITLIRRDRSRWLRSCWNQDVKMHGFAGDYEAWLDSIGAVRDWDDGIAAIEATLNAPVDVLVMEDELSSGHFLGRKLLARAGVPEEVIAAIVPSRVQNESLGPRAMDFMQDVNALPIPGNARSAVAKLVRRHRSLFDEPVG